MTVIARHLVWILGALSGACLFAAQFVSFDTYPGLLVIGFLFVAIAFLIHASVSMLHRSGIKEPKE